CRGEKIMETYSKRGYFDKNPDLVIHARKRRSDARVGLWLSLRNGMKELMKKERNGDTSLCEERKAIEVKIVRSLGKASKEMIDTSIRIETKDEILDVIKHPATKDRQELTVLVPVTKDSKGNYKLPKKIRVNSGFLTASILKPNMGSFMFEINGFENGEYVLYAKRDGTPIGVNRYLMRFKGVNKVSEELLVPLDCVK
ncbi:hypothetical protein OAB57_03800, partial [Bacteriovoracaceae bacterium]|nr:hypothetical protein [Bacteriovoracaceae bacterium]